jgi:hypothetical protein
MVDNAALPPLEGLRVNGVGLWWEVLSRNKRTVTLIFIGRKVGT